MPVPRESSFRQTYLREPDPEVFLRIEQIEVNNPCFWREYHAGDNGPRNRALALILHGPFLTEVRSDQQLGYIVWAAQRLIATTSAFTSSSNHRLTRPTLWKTAQTPLLPPIPSNFANCHRIIS